MSRVAAWEMMMRVLPIAIALGIVGATMSTSGGTQVPDAQINAQSLQWQRAGEAALAAGNFQAADDALESALIIDPRNRGAFIALARVAQKQKLYGQAIRFTNKALTLEPNDPVALGVQGEAMVELGAVARAQQNLAKIRTLCGNKPCAPATSLAALIQRGPAMARSDTPAAPKKN
ncbi:tetratricopeptide repeat protein [Sphingomonas sp. LHG3406-1]|uniref:tetratricopeptide repeat protein n=1 Tax=Sphingomonas sp. LHG3406-1 TaxID=2804617 RepID=UPI00262EAFF8|nr:tetratricopeptide repeat protein [Sphingomonas sp. LHG3406-1]